MVLFVKPTDDGKSLDLIMDGNKPLTLDLYRQYISIKVNVVALSNYVYSSWMDPHQQPWHRENLKLTYEMLVNHTEHGLHVKIMELYDKFPPEYQGGPLYFKILMDLMVSDLQSVAEAVLHHMKAYKIRDTKGEDVSKAVTLLRNGCDQLHSVHKLPTEMPLFVVKVFQTTSNSEFNKIFAHEELQIHRNPYEDTKDAFAIPGHLYQNPGAIMVRIQDEIKGRCDLYFGQANQHYTRLSYNGQWRVPRGNGDPTALMASTGSDSKRPCIILKAAVLLADDTCWNCGEKGHRLTDCPHPKHEKQIEANRKAYNVAKLKAGGKTPDGSGKGKWAPPGKGEGRKREINGKPMYYHKRTGKWVPDKDADRANLAGDDNGESPPSKKKTRRKSKKKPKSTPEPSSDDDGSRSSDEDPRALLSDTVENFGNVMRNLSAVLAKVKAKSE
jgi:Zinc knuckle